jgi:hypothetical protein
MESDEQTPKTFTYDEALQVFPDVRTLTERAVTEATIVEAQMLALKGGDVAGGFRQWRGVLLLEVSGAGNRLFSRLHVRVRRTHQAPLEPCP